MGAFREWVSDNLRYILLGLAIILILVVAVFAVKLIGGVANGSAGTTESESTSEKDVIVTPNAETDKPSNNLVQNDPKVLETVQAYYAAMGNKDMETLKKLVPSLTESEQQTIANDTLIESYNNVTCSSKKGPVDGSYVVYAVYDGKVANINTVVPSLANLYLLTNTDGSLYVADYDSDETAKKFIESAQEDAEVKKLVNDIHQKYAEAVNSDEDLKNLINEMGMPQTEVNIPNSNEVGVEVNQLVAANTVCNVRADSNEEAEILGMLNEGESVTRVKQLDNGWSQIRYNDGEGYVMSEFLSSNAGTTDETQ